MIKVTFEVEMLVDPETTQVMWQDCGLMNYIPGNFDAAIMDALKYMGQLINDGSRRIQVDSLTTSNVKIQDSRISELLAQQKELEAML